MNRQQQIIAAAVAQADALSRREGWPGHVTLTVYESDADYYALRPHEGRVPEAAKQQRAMVTDVSEALRLRGHQVKLVTLRVADYRA